MATPSEGEERKECEEGTGRKGQHIVGELGKRGGSERQCRLTLALGTNRERSSERESNLSQVTQQVNARGEELGPWAAEVGVRMEDLGERGKYSCSELWQNGVSEWAALPSEAAT